MGIEHVYDSRSTEFADQIRRDTDGYGVDIVLNSLTGAAQRAGLELLSFGGRFVEIGKRDIYGNTRLGLFPFRRNLSFYDVDLGADVREPPGAGRRPAEHGVPSSSQTVTLPLPESTHYPLGDAATAIRVMGARRAHRQAGARRPARRAQPAWWCRRSRLRPSGPTAPTSSPAVSVASGCSSPRRWPRPAVAGSCSAPARSRAPRRWRRSSSSARPGADIEVECGDIAEPDTAERLVAAATATGLPLRGVLHAAAVVEDATLANITDELIDRDWAPKVYGAWNLHQATADQPLDWFCSFSSAAALVGSPGQGAYAAANSWLDAFTHWRRAQGLPATAIAWGAWAEIGRADGAGRRRGDARYQLPTRAPTRSRRCCATTAPTPAMRRSREHRG